MPTLYEGFPPSVLSHEHALRDIECVLQFVYIDQSKIIQNERGLFARKKFEKGIFIFNIQVISSVIIGVIFMSVRQKQMPKTLTG